MKIEYKLLLAFGTIILIMIVGNLFSIQMSEEKLHQSIGQSHVTQVEPIIESVDREVYYRVEQIVGYGRDVLLQDTLRQSNQAMAAMTDREGWIRQQGRDWRTAPLGTITPFMQGLMDSPLAEELWEKKEFYTQKWMQKPLYPEMFVTNRYGVIIATTGRTSDYLQADEEWYRQAVAQQDFWLGDMAYDESTGISSCAIVVKLYDENQEYAGLFKALLNLETLHATLTTAAERHTQVSQHKHHVQVKLLTKDNRLIFTSDHGYEINKDMSGYDFMKRIDQGGDKGFFALAGDTPGEEEKIFAYARSSGYRDYGGIGWLLILEHDFNEAFAPVDSLVHYLWAIVVVIVFVALLFTYYFSQSFGRLVRKLRATTEQLQQKVVEQGLTEAALQIRTADLNGRVKELNCLYGISKIVEKENYTIEETLRKVADLVCSSWQYPEIACVQIKLDRYDAYKTDNFTETEWRLSQDIRISKEKAGAVEIYYLEEKPVMDEGPFLNEERTLLNAIAEQLGYALERREAIQEKQKMQAFIFQQEKLASVGQLAAGVAHEINNPLNYISSNLGSLNEYLVQLMEYVNASTTNLKAEELQQLRKALDIDFIAEDIKDLISESIEGTDRISAIVQNLKSFSRVDEGKCKETDINDCLENTIKVIWNELKYKAKIIKEYGELPLTQCYPQHLSQIFMNFLVNAVQAIEKEGEIKIKTWQDGKSIYVSITDTGHGIPEENISKLFEPFFTTKEVGKGTGLGLSIAHEIIQKHKGRIDVESEVGRGTTFTVTLPITGTV